MYRQRNLLDQVHSFSRLLHTNMAKLVIISVSSTQRYRAVQWSWFARVNALCNLSRKKSREVAASLPGRLPSRHCFTLCITMEVELELRNSTNASTVAVAKISRGRGWRVGKKAYYFGWPDHEFVEKCILGHLIARATSYCLLPDTLWLRASKKWF